MPVPSQESEWSCTCLLRVLIVPLSTILIYDFGIVPTVWYFFVFFIIYHLTDEILHSFWKNVLNETVITSVFISSLKQN